MKKLSLRGIRVFGCFVGAIAILFYFTTGNDPAVTFRNLSVPVPLYLVFAAMSAVIVVLPGFSARAALALLPSRLSAAIEPYLDIAAAPKTTALGENPSSGDIASLVATFEKRSDRRFFLVVAGFVIFFAGLLPFLVIDQIARSAFRNSSSQLTRAAQGNPLNFSSTDTFRALLLQSEDALEAFKESSSGTLGLRDLLIEIYEGDPADDEEFEDRLLEIYKNRVDRHIKNPLGVLRPEALRTVRSRSLESDGPNVAYLTLLGVICNENSNEGQHLKPLVVGRQFLLRALKLAEGSQQEIPGTHNALGVNYATSLRKYAAFNDLLSKDLASSSELARAIDEVELTKPITLARKAYEQYGYAVAGEHRYKYLRARYLNNKTDLSLWLIDSVHVRKNVLVGADSLDENFLREIVGPPSVRGQKYDASALLGVLISLEKEVSEAVTLKQDPRFYFTRGQLYSVAGKLNEEFSFQDDTWGSSEHLRAESLQDLETARELCLPTRFFQKDRGGELYLGWLWDSEEGSKKLEEIIEQDCQSDAETRL